MRAHIHYASTWTVRLATIGGVCAGASTYTVLPDAALSVSADIAKNLWLLIGPIGAFAIQIAMQLMAIGDDKRLTAREQSLLSTVVDQRLRYIWDITSVAVLALLVCLVAASVTSPVRIARTLISFSYGLTVWTALLAARLPHLYREIRDFRWRLARERNESELRASIVAALHETDSRPPPNIPEPERHTRPA